MVWKIEFDSAAEKEFARLGTSAQRDIARYLDKLSTASDPRMRGKPLSGDKAGLWRYRVNKYRIICKIEETRVVIYVIRVAKRDKLYD